MSPFFKKMLQKKIQKERIPYGMDLPLWAKDFQENIAAIQDEWKEYISQYGLGRQFDEISKEQVDLNKDKMWQVVPIYAYSHFNEKELPKFPILTQIVKKNVKHFTLVMFSTTQAGKVIPPHHGNNHGVLRLQIGIDIIEHEKCYLRVHDKIVFLKEKEMFIFDDTFEHELVNNGKCNRTVLIIDFYKKLPIFYHTINKVLNGEIGKSDYVLSVIEKLKFN